VWSKRSVAVISSPSFRVDSAPFSVPLANHIQYTRELNSHLAISTQHGDGPEEPMPRTSKLVMSLSETRLCNRSPANLKDRSCAFHLATF